MVKRQKQTKGLSGKAAQKQKQRQTQIVNVHIGSKRPRKRAKKGAAKKGEAKNGVQIIPAFNPPPIINFPPGFGLNQQSNAWATPPPPSAQRQHTVFPEDATSAALGANSAARVPLTFETSLPRAAPSKTKVDLTATADPLFEAPPVVEFNEPEPIRDPSDPAELELAAAEEAAVSASAEAFAAKKAAAVEEAESALAQKDAEDYAAQQLEEERKALLKAQKKERAAQRREAQRTAALLAPTTPIAGLPLIPAGFDESLRGFASAEEPGAFPDLLRGAMEFARGSSILPPLAGSSGSLVNEVYAGSNEPLSSGSSVGNWPNPFEALIAEEKPTAAEKRGRKGTKPKTSVAVGSAGSLMGSANAPPLGFSDVPYSSGGMQVSAPLPKERKTDVSFIGSAPTEAKPKGGLERQRYTDVAERTRSQSALTATEENFFV